MSTSQFIKETSLPVPVASDPYFSHFVDLYEPLFQSKTKWQNYRKERSITSTTSDTRHSIVEHVKAKDAFQTFDKGDMTQYELDQDFVKQFNLYKSLYHGDNRGSHFISIDLKKANFSSLRFVDAHIVDKCETYEEFVSQFSSNEHFVRSKKIRQVIFGHLNPKRQSKVEKKIMEHLLRLLLETNQMWKPEHVITFTNDEIVLKCDSKEHALRMVHQLTGKVFPNNQWKGVPFHIEAFYLRGLFAKNQASVGYAKEFYHPAAEKPFELKNVQSFLFAQVYKNYIGEPITKMDRAFIHNKVLCFASNIFED